MSAGTPLCTSRSEEHTSELQLPCNLVCRLLLEKKKKDYLNMLNLNKKIKYSISFIKLLSFTCYTETVFQKAATFFASLFDDPHGVFFFNDSSTTEIYTLSLHDALPI